MTESFHLFSGQNSVKEAYKKIESTLTDLGNSRINENQARSAFLSEMIDITNSNANVAVAKKMDQLAGNAGADSSAESKAVLENWKVSKLDAYPGYLTFTPRDESKDHVAVILNVQTGVSGVLSSRENSDARNRECQARVDALEHTAGAYFNGSATAAQTEASLSQQIKDDNNAGFSILNEPRFFNALNKYDFDNPIKFTSINEHEFGFSNPEANYSRRITVDATTGKVKAEDLHFETQSLIKNMTRDAVLGGCIAGVISTRILRNPIPGMIVGTVVGAIVGLKDGPDHLNDPTNFWSRPGEIFKQTNFFPWLK